MAKPELGTKRVCPTTGRKFYDLNKDPIVSPYTGQSYPRSVFEPQAKAAAAVAAKPDEDEDEVEAADSAVELVSLDEADAEATEKDAVVTSEDDIEVEDDVAPDDDTFLEEDEEGDDDVADLIDGDIEGDEDV
ncbi:MAG TPA: TIGR02300 family protein [Bosea sp. (in: a-proteobacteria)]|uniref:TIGR02300 family protein n=1 Tax=Bosea sp. (in: a-proteobacteria) TaxID=1871050 RepID=UPI002DDD8045|nr:TIGR02300 family protein [Bosea sp. (in: a-proteobacteria)]HEV2556644.1 TIGR02300 family protein [Bosea sp. (in: a-proteobacteria)]